MACAISWIMEINHFHGIPSIIVACVFKKNMHEGKYGRKE
jgi:hypothetical protein